MTLEKLVCGFLVAVAASGFLMVGIFAYLMLVVLPQQRHDRYEAFKRIEPNTRLTSKEFHLLWPRGYVLPRENHPPP